MPAAVLAAPALREAGPPPPLSAAAAVESTGVGSKRPRTALGDLVSGSATGRELGGSNATLTDAAAIKSYHPTAPMSKLSATVRSSAKQPQPPSASTASARIGMAVAAGAPTSARPSIGGSSSMRQGSDPASARPSIGGGSSMRHGSDQASTRPSIGGSSSGMRQGAERAPTAAKHPTLAASSSSSSLFKATASSAARLVPSGLGPSVSFAAGRVSVGGKPLAALTTPSQSLAVSLSKPAQLR